MSGTILDAGVNETVPALKNLTFEKVYSRGVQSFCASGPHWKKNCFGPHIKHINTNEN